MKSPKRSIVDKKLLKVLVIVFVLAAAFCIRFPSFYRPHDGKDDIQYVALAMKLELFGFRGYNLSGVKRFVSTDGHLTAVFPVNERQGNTILKGLPHFYDIPLFHKPPLFPLMISSLHGLFAPDKPYVVLREGAALSRISLKNKLLFMKAQLYCALVPFGFSILLILSAFILGAYFFSSKVGIYSAAFLAISPIEILSSQNIWPDTAVSFFVAVSFILYYMAVNKSSAWDALLSGLCAGCAALTKPSGNCVILVIFLFELWRRKLLSREFAVFIITAILVALPWYGLYAKTYGSPFFIPMMAQPELVNTYPWHNFVFNRPWYMYFVNIPAQTPVFVLIYPAIFGIFGKEKKMFLFLWIAVFFAIFLFVKVGKELRYLLPAYPAIAVLSAQLLERAELKVNKRFNNLSGSIAAAGIIIFCCFWGVIIANKALELGLGEVRFPF